MEIQTYKKEILGQMMIHYSDVTSRSALAAFTTMHRLHYAYPGIPEKYAMNQWKKVIDAEAAKAMEAGLNEIPFYTIKVGSEGRKEIKYAGEAAPCVGNGGYGNKRHPHMIGVSDVVEGTTSASQKKPGASSVIAVVSESVSGKGIRPTPPDTDYLIKFIGPKQANGVVDLNRPHKQNLEALIKKLGIRADQLTQVTLDPSKLGRECNKEFVDSAKELGVNVKLISAGDLMPGILAASSDPNNYVIVVGRGGYEEGTIVAVAVKSLGGFMQAREYYPDTEKQSDQVLLLDDLVMANPNEALVSASFITKDDQWFHQPGIRMVNGEYVVTTMTVTHEGIKFVDSVIK